MESKKINQLATNVAPLSTDLTIIGDPSTGVSKKVTLSQIASIFAGAVDFYANLAAFPASGTLNTIYCAKDTQKLYLWSGSAYVETFPSQAVLNTYQLLSEKGVSNGYASLDSSGKVPIAQLPSSIMEYKGLWSAATNTPTLANGTGDTGDVYICSAAGSVNFGAGAITFAVGDYVIYSGSIWQRSSGAVGTVTSVGLSSATSGVTIGSSPVTTSGTITLAIATATTSQNGLLSSTDWATFNSKESVLTFSSPLVRTTNTISIPAATTSVNGYLASADFTTFNNKQNAITLTTTGTSGASTLVGATLNIPNYGSALTGYVPYTGATQDVDLDTFKLNAQSIHAKGTGGLGHIGLKHQSASATASANEVSLFADSLGDLSWQNGNLYLSKFITSSNTAARSYTFPNANGTVALTSDLANYVDLTTAQTIGGTKTFTDATKNNGGIFLQNASSSSLAGYMNIGGLTNGVKFTSGGGVSNTFTLPSATGYTFTFPNATGTLALTSDISYPVTSVFGRTGAVVATSGDYTTAQVTEVTNLYFTDSRARLALSFVAGSGAYNSTTGVITIPTNNTQITNGAAYITLTSLSAGVGISYNNTTGVITNSAPDQVVALTASTGISVTGTYPNFTITNTSPSSGGTVTSVAALTLGTTGTDLSSSVATSTTTPVITLNVPTASATNRGALSSADWTTFNNKQSTITLTTTGTSGAATFSANTLNIPDYGSALSGYLPLTGGTLTGALSGTSASFSSSVEVGAGTYSSGLAKLYTSSVYGTILTGKSGSSSDMLLTDRSGNIALQIVANSATPNVVIGNNLGLGVTPSAWAVKAIDISTTGAVFGDGIAFDYTAGISQNCYRSGNTTWNYKLTGVGTSRFQLDSNIFSWYQAPSGTAGNAITFTQAMTLFSDGNLLLTNGTVSNAGYKLDVNGTGRFSGQLSADGGVSSSNEYTSTRGNNTRLFYSGSATTGYQYMALLNTTAYTIFGIEGTTAGSLLTNGTAYASVLTSVGNTNLEFGTNQVKRLTIAASTGAATFSSTGLFQGSLLTVGSAVAATNVEFNINGVANKAGRIQFQQSGVSSWLIGNGAASENGNFEIYNANGQQALVFVKATSAATFSSSVTATLSLYLKEGNIDAFRIYTDGVNGSLFFRDLYYNQTRMTISNTGNVGIGTASPYGKFQVYSVATSPSLTVGTAAAAIISCAEGQELAITANGTAPYGINFQARNNNGGGPSGTSYPIIFNPLGGNVGIGTSSPSTVGTATTIDGILNVYNSGSGKIYARGGGSGEIGFEDAGAGSGDKVARWIYDGGVLSFQRINDAFTAIGSTPLTITSGGELCLGVTSAYGTNLLNVNGGIYATSSIAAVVAADIDMLAFVNTGATYSKACVVASMTATGGTGSYFFYGQQSTSTVALKIFSNGNIQNTNNSYGAISDARLKENIKDATPKLDDLMKVKVRNYNLKGESNKQLGVISQELEAIFPNMIEESTNMGENMKIKGVKYSVFVPMLIKAVQELKAEIEILKNK